MPKRRLVPGRIEDQVTLPGLRRHHAVHLRRLIPLGYLNRADHVVAKDRRRIRVNHSALGMHHQQRAVDSHARQHRRQQRRLVLAIAITVFEDVRCRMRLIAAHAHLNVVVANLLLHKLTDGLGLVIEIRLACSQLGGLGGNLRRGCQPSILQCVVPLADALPRPVLRLGQARPCVVHRHPSRQRAGSRRHGYLLQVDRRLVVHLPAVAVVLQVGAIQRQMVRPRRGVGKSRRQHQRKTLVHPRFIVLEEPARLRQVRPLSPLILIGHHSPRIHSRRIGSLGFVIRVQYTTLSRRSHLKDFAVLHCILMPRRINAPHMHRHDLGVLIEPDSRRRVVPPLRAKDLHHPPHMLHCLPVRRHGVSYLAQQDRGLRLAGKARWRCLRRRLHPVRNIAARPKHSGCAERSRRQQQPSRRPCRLLWPPRHHRRTSLLNLPRNNVLTAALDGWNTCLIYTAHTVCVQAKRSPPNQQKTLTAPLQ